MTATFAAVLGLTLAQPPAAPAAQDYYPLTGREIDLPIEYKGDRKGIGQIQLYASADKGQTWPLVATVLPDKTAFKYTAPKDGMYWFHIVIVDRAGKKDPANLTAELPAMKVLVDTVRPVVEFKTPRRNGEELTVEWDVRDDFPNDAATKVFFHRGDAPPDEWWPVSLPPGPRTGVRFPSGTTGPVQVKVTVSDLAGNSGEGLREVPAVAGATQTSTSLSAGPGPITPPAPALPSPPPLAMPALPAPPPLAPAAAAIPIEPLAPPAIAPVMPAAPAVSPTLSPAPITPATPAPTAPAPLATAPPTGPAPLPTAPSVAPVPASPSVSPGPVLAGSGGAVPTFDPRDAGTPASHGSPTPAPASAPPGAEPSRPQVVKSLRFDLTYQVDQRGPSGIQRVDLWTTRDDGRTWVWWSQHPGNDPTVRVNLGTPSNTQPEGSYGFRLVPMSGAGLSDGTPVAGDAPDVRVVIDVTAPAVRIFPPTSDPADPTALILQWEAADR
ncbi:MAG TPA: hypothetical protein VH092_08485, partial [Urbifossiella sp.]|nr:hypothetical protein [Urbifossiella sp.]